jgi:hypothetical protein
MGLSAMWRRGLELYEASDMTCHEFQKRPDRMRVAPLSIAVCVCVCVCVCAVVIPSHHLRRGRSPSQQVLTYLIAGQSVIAVLVGEKIERSTKPLLASKSCRYLSPETRSWRTPPSLRETPRSNGPSCEFKSSVPRVAH